MAELSAIPPSPYQEAAKVLSEKAALQWSGQITAIHSHDGTNFQEHNSYLEIPWKIIPGYSQALLNQVRRHLREMKK